MGLAFSLTGKPHPYRARFFIWMARRGEWMRLKVNGEIMETGAGTVQALLDELKVGRERVAVEVNLAIIKKKDYAFHSLKEGDEVEIVTLIGGGGQKSCPKNFSL
jgi:sulfur carrier protein